MNEISPQSTLGAATTPRRSLHVLTRRDDDLAASVISRQQAAGGAEVKVIDLVTTPADYPAIVEGIFAADTVAVW